MEDAADSEEDDELQVGGLLKRAKKSNDEKEFKDREDGYNFLTPSSSVFTKSLDWSDDDQRNLIRNCFITGENIDNLDESDADELDENDLFEGDDDFKMDVGEEAGDDDGAKPTTAENDGSARSNRLEAKQKLKARFDAEYDETNEYYNTLKEELDAQAKANHFKIIFDNLFFV